MARPGITYLEVAKAATQLVEQHKRPSIEAIRQVLGSGSNSTINNYLRQWRERQGQHLEAQQGLPDTLLIAVKGLYEALQADATQQIAQIKQEHQQALAELERQLHQQQHMSSALTEQNQTLVEQLTASLQEVTDLQAKLEEVKHALQNETANKMLLEARLIDKAVEADRLIEQLKHAQHNLDHYREAIRQQREEEKQRYEGQLAKVEQLLQQQQAVIATAQQALAAQKAQLEGLEHQRNHLEQAHVQLQQDYQTQALLVQKQQLDYQFLQAQYDQLALDHQTANEERHTARTQVHQLEKQYEKSQGRLELLEQSLRKAETDITLLHANNRQLVQEKAGLLAQLKHAQSFSSEENT